MGEAGNPMELILTAISGIIAVCSGAEEKHLYATENDWKELMMSYYKIFRIILINFLLRRINFSMLIEN